ncbi:MAG: autotransporter-associated beta strand repeat-containing protein [Chthoniobacter sp.]
MFGTVQKLTIDGPGNTDITSVIQTGAGSLTKNGAGTLFLSGASTYGGGTILNSGTLNLEIDSVPSGAAPSVSPVLTGPLGTGLFTINGGTVGTSTFSGTNTAHSVGNDVLVNANFGVSNVPRTPVVAPTSGIDGGVLNSIKSGLFNSDGINFAGNVFLNKPGAVTVITTNSGFVDFTGGIYDLNAGTGGGLTFAGNTATYLGAREQPHGG